MSKLKKKPILLFLIILVVLYAIIYIVPRVSGALVSSYIAEYGELKISDETTAYFVRSEKVYVARANGETNYFFDQGSLVRKDTKVMQVKSGSSESVEPSRTYAGIIERLGDDVVKNKNYRTKDVGVVSYAVDGYEQIVTPKTMKKADYSFFKKLSQDDVLDLQRDRVIKNEPVFKIVDRTKWYMVCFVDAAHLDRYEKGGHVRVEFEDDYVDTTVYRAEAVGDKAKIILQTDYYYDRFAETRVADVSLVTYQENGLIVENSSITEEKGQTGVYVKNKSDDFFFVPIKIYATDGEKSLIADDFYYDTENDGETVITVEVYDEILKKAE